MAINNLSRMNEVLKNYSAEEWTKSAKIDFESPLKIGESDFNLKETGSSTTSFSDMLADSLKDVNSLQKEADTAIQKLASGQSQNLHETMLAVEKAEIAFKTMNQIRMKVIDAYKEVMRMQI